MTEADIVRRIVFVGGPPRSGTTVIAKSLNLHPGFVAAIDDHVFECWGLYDYRRRVGLVHELRTRQVPAEEAQKILQEHLFADKQFLGAASSPQTARFPRIPLRVDPATVSPRSVLDQDLVRHAIPLAQFSSGWRLCLKSPEISFTLPQLAGLFPDAKFVLVQRPIIEVAASMQRMGESVKRFPVYQRRWRLEIGEDQQPVLPPGVPQEWEGLWRRVSDFQRCAIYAASYIRALVSGLSALPAERFFVCDHARLCARPWDIFSRLACFLGCDTAGFAAAASGIRSENRPIPPEWVDQMQQLGSQLPLVDLAERSDRLPTLHFSVSKTLATVAPMGNDRALPLPQNPIFIVGYPRSGTTLLQRLLATYPRFHTFPETHFFSVIETEMQFDMNGHILDSCLDSVCKKIQEKMAFTFSADEEKTIRAEAEARRLTAKALFEYIVKRFLFQLYPGIATESGWRWIEKTPTHANFLERIIAAYPQAQIIHIVRHPVTAILSRKSKFPFNRETPLKSLTWEWKLLVENVERCQKLFPSRIYVQRYEDVAKKPVQELNGIAKFLHVSFDFSQVLNGKQKDSPDPFILPFETWKLKDRNRAVVNTNESYESRISEADVSAIEVVVKDNMAVYGYRHFFEELADAQTEK